jgi:hypothetical protein
MPTVVGDSLEYDRALAEGLAQMAAASAKKPASLDEGNAADLDFDVEEDGPEITIEVDVDNDDDDAVSMLQGEMRERMDLGDFSGAFESALGILAIDPLNAEAAATEDECRATLERTYISKLGAIHRVPKRALSPDKIRSMSIDRNARLLLSLVDGTRSIEMLLDRSDMARLDALRILAQLVDQRVIHLT